MVDVSRLASASASELEVVLESLFEGAATTPVRAAPGRFFGHDPVTGALFITGEDHSQLRLMICRALIAAAQFHQEKPPGWPDLPLRFEEIEAALEADCIRCNVAGHFGSSLSLDGWSPEHPGLNDYVGGLLFDQSTPIEIRHNSSLQRQFSPKKLKGLGSLRWRSSKQVVQDRVYEIKCAAYEAAGLIG